MEGIAKYVLEMAGQGKDEFYLPESKCIRVEDVEVGLDMMGHKKKVLTSVGLPELDDMSTSRQYLYGSSLCIDSISPSRIEKACSLSQCTFKISSMLISCLFLHRHYFKTT